MERDAFKEKIEEYQEEVEEDKTGDWEEDMPSQTRGSQKSKKSQNTPILFWAALAFIIFAFFFVLIRSWNQVSGDDIKKLNEDIAQLDARLAKIEETQKGVADLQVQLSAIVQAIKRLEGTDQALHSQVNQLGERVSKVGKAGTGAAPKPPAVQAPKQPGAKRYHVVQKGDTLFRIAQKYGKKVADLQKLNNLDPKQEIFPGQKLLIE